MFSHDQIGISGDHPHESAPQQVLACHGCSELVTTRGVGSRPNGAGASAEAFAVDFVLHRNYHNSTEAGTFVSTWRQASDAFEAIRWSSSLSFLKFAAIAALETVSILGRRNSVKVFE